MVFRVAGTWARPSNSQAGQPSPGAGAQTSYSGNMSFGYNAQGELVASEGGTPRFQQAGGMQGTGAPPPGAAGRPVTGGPERPTKGRRSWLRGTPQSFQRGGPEPQNNLQARPPGSMPNKPPIYGGNIPVYTPYYSRGAAAFVQNFGKVLYNPIGAGIPVGYRTQAQYARPGQYINGSIWWTSQDIPTSITPQSLTDPQELADILDPLTVYAVARVNG